MNSPKLKLLLTGIGFFWLILFVIIALVAFIISRMPTRSLLDKNLHSVLAANNISELDLGESPHPDKVALGEQLFFDKVLSGNRDISCATCHHPQLAGADGRSLPVGTGGKGLGEERTLGTNRALIPRNAPELFNRGSAEWVTMFWDGRVASSGYDEPIHTPAGENLPDGLDSALAAQAMFPPTSRDEMRGDFEENEVGAIADDDPNAIWNTLMQRVLDIPEYQTLFQTAYPDIPTSQLGFQHAANALAAYEIDAFSFSDSPWDRYLAGDDFALSQGEKYGAILFYGKAGCSQCHSGNLMTDQDYHNIAVPHMGPGKNADGMDFGRFHETNNPADKFAFRTPPLANIALTGPYMHNGSYLSLEETVRHHLDATSALLNYDDEKLSADVRATCKLDDATNALILETLDPLMQTPTELNDIEISQLIAFLNALTSPSASNLNALVPDEVPSGLPIQD